MLINISDVLTKPYKTVDEIMGLNMEQCQLAFGSFTIHHLEPVQLIVEHLRDREYRVSIATKLILILTCDRCLKDVDVPLDIHGSRHISLGGSETLETDESDELDQADFIQGYNLDLEQLLQSELVLNWPMKILCDEECAGLCNCCGSSKSNEGCDCEDTSLDPRMSVVRDLFKNIDGLSD